MECSDTKREANESAEDAAEDAEPPAPRHGLQLRATEQLDEALTNKAIGPRHPTRRQVTK